MSATIDDLERRRERARLEGGEKRIEAPHAKGRLTARERLSVLLDETKGFIVNTGSVRKGFYTMAQELGLPAAAFRQRFRSVNGMPCREKIAVAWAVTSGVVSASRVVVLEVGCL